MKSGTTYRWIVTTNLTLEQGVQTSKQRLPESQLPGKLSRPHYPSRQKDPHHQIQSMNQRNDKQPPYLSRLKWEQEQRPKYGSKRRKGKHPTKGRNLRGATSK